MNTIFIFLLREFNSNYSVFFFIHYLIKLWKINIAISFAENEFELK